MADKDETVIETVCVEGKFYAERRANNDRRCGKRCRVLFERRHKIDRRYQSKEPINIKV